MFGIPRGCWGKVPCPCRVLQEQVGVLEFRSDNLSQGPLLYCVVFRFRIIYSGSYLYGSKSHCHWLHACCSWRAPNVQQERCGWGADCPNCSEQMLPPLQPLLWHKEQETGWHKQVAAATSASLCWAWWCLEVIAIRSFDCLLEVSLPLTIWHLEPLFHLFGDFTTLWKHLGNISRHMSS